MMTREISTLVLASTSTRSHLIAAAIIGATFGTLGRIIR